ncbi:hypothetical protein HPB51_021426 [Rhipicephalus microplus]|uniref:Zn-finger transcription factor n=1 Tax=Rhipicephalus microplus TaxID=6941 RepID=A0A9J6DQ76_RHIMP|nr:hypothetical protein HPB51_021426 [Rhipicephalus microplus]
MPRIQSPESPLLLFKEEPLFVVLAILVPTTPLLSFGCKGLKQIAFRLKRQHVDAIRSSSTDDANRECSVRVHLRFRLLYTNSEQDDSYPLNLAVEVNGESLALPAPIPCKVSGGPIEWVCLPINIVSSCKLKPSVMNKVRVTWHPVSGRHYVVGLFLVKKLEAATVLCGLEQLSVALTRDMIKKKAKRRATISDDVAITRFHVSLTCPLSQSRMKVPCRARSCRHLDCFDGFNYLQVNERRPTWTCPVCMMRAPLSSLVVDQVFAHILANVPNDCDGVVFHEDGSWTSSQRDQGATICVTPPLFTARGPVPPSRSSFSQQVGRSLKQPTIEVIDLTNSSSDDEAGCGVRC